MKGGIGWKLITLALDATHESYIWCSDLETLIYNCAKFIRKLIYIQIQFCIKVEGLNRSNSANKQPIWKRWYPRES